MTELERMTVARDALERELQSERAYSAKLVFERDAALARVAELRGLFLKATAYIGISSSFKDGSMLEELDKDLKTIDDELEREGDTESILSESDMAWLEKQSRTKE